MLDCCFADPAQAKAAFREYGTGAQWDLCQENRRKVRDVPDSFDRPGQDTVLLGDLLNLAFGQGWSRAARCIHCHRVFRETNDGRRRYDSRCRNWLFCAFCAYVRAENLVNSLRDDFPPDGQFVFLTLVPRAGFPAAPESVAFLHLDIRAVLATFKALAKSKDRVFDGVLAAAEFDVRALCDVPLPVGDEDEQKDEDEEDEPFFYVGAHGHAVAFWRSGETLDVETLEAFLNAAYTRECNRLNTAGLPGAGAAGVKLKVLLLDGLDDVKRTLRYFVGKAADHAKKDAAGEFESRGFAAAYRALAPDFQDVENGAGLSRLNEGIVQTILTVDESRKSESGKGGLSLLRRWGCFSARSNTSLFRRREDPEAKAGRKRKAKAEAKVRALRLPARKPRSNAPDGPAGVVSPVDPLGAATSAAPAAPPASAPGPGGVIPLPEPAKPLKANVGAVDAVLDVAPGAQSTAPSATDSAPVVVPDGRNQILRGHARPRARGPPGRGPPEVNLGSVSVS